jgi:hypothetical protein
VVAICFNSAVAARREPVSVNDPDNFFLTVAVGFRRAGPSSALGGLTREQNWNKVRTIEIQERQMTDLVQDVVSMVCMSAFLISTALWIGAL